MEAQVFRIILSFSGIDELGDQEGKLSPGDL